MKQLFSKVKGLFNRLAYSSYLVTTKNEPAYKRVQDKAMMVDAKVFDKLNMFLYPAWGVTTFLDDVRQTGILLNLAAVQARNEQSLYSIVSKINTERMPAYQFFRKTHASNSAPDLMHFIHGVKELAQQAKAYDVDFNQRNDAYELTEIKQDIDEILEKTELIVDELLALQLIITNL